MAHERDLDKIIMDASVSFGNNELKKLNCIKL